jgi:hypothetical protein
MKFVLFTALLTIASVSALAEEVSTECAWSEQNERSVNPKENMDQNEIKTPVPATNGVSAQ